MLKKHFLLLSMLKMVVLLEIFKETLIFDEEWHLFIYFFIFFVAL